MSTSKQNYSERLAVAQDEIDRLRKINHELVCSHNDLLVVIARLEEGQPSAFVCACGNPSILGVAHWSHECRKIGIQEPYGV